MFSVFVIFDFSLPSVSAEITLLLSLQFRKSAPITHARKCMCENYDANTSTNSGQTRWDPCHVHTANVDSLGAIFPDLAVPAAPSSFPRFGPLSP